ncbi:conserved hypothetical protein [Psychromonas ingrahamii 37]|uniref:Uncharacterized protein n=1 Tax=Psychromonas ingrahamii (strain DSM 17664 / CCUG 51855 / 37) TaxID=357804 RepID=A1SSA1_PSYIN|nr:hypothetical protein [Psychromonas ingrahamii]ABM02366.1 conserved hypothetical protein [Psychromonas ingrahamii 37]
MKKLLLFFAAGCLGALGNSITVWQFGQLGITSTWGVSIDPSFSPAWLYPRIVWGGLWGFLFILPILQSRLLLKGTILSLFPTAVMLFIVFPYQANKGIAGIELGLMTPVFVIFFNWVWGIITAITIKYAK